MSYNMQLESSWPVAKRRPLGSTATDATALPGWREEWKVQCGKINRAILQQLIMFAEPHTKNVMQLATLLGYGEIQMNSQPINNCVLFRGKV